MNVKKVILIVNVIIMLLFCMLCVILVEPAHNHFVQYGAQGTLLPVPTRLAIDARLYLMIIPILWIGLSCGVHRFIRAREKYEQMQLLLLFLWISLFLGLLMLVFYGLASILPYLMIGAAG